MRREAGLGLGLGLGLGQGLGLGLEAWVRSCTSHGYPNRSKFANSDMHQCEVPKYPHVCTEMTV